MKILDEKGLLFLWQQLKSFIPTALKNPKTLTFNGYISGKYDGSSEINIQFPSVDLVNDTSGSPIGEIVAFMGKTPPANYLICDGTSYKISDYPELSSFFKTQFGKSNYFGGNGTTTFSVPDLRGEFLRGTGGTASTTWGAGGDVGTHQDPTQHAYSLGNGNVAYQALGGEPSNIEYANHTGKGNTTLLQSPTQCSKTSGNWTQTYTAHPTNTSVLYIIKAKPTYYSILSKHNYSLEEHIVGTWVNGKVLYEKTVACGTLPNATKKSVPHKISNIDIVCSYDGIAKSVSKGQFIKIPWIPDPESKIANGVTVYFDATNIFIKCGVDYTEWSDIYVTIRYTKIS